MLQVGSLVDGKYRILSEIGHGGMSVVYMAINEKANKTWAIKEVRKDGVLDFEAVRQGLVVETDMLKKLKHQYLPSIIDVIDQDDSFLIVMDYVEGNSLEKALKEYGAQPQESVIEWAKQLCDVLGYLHTREPAIIYRDMKPANVMLKPDGHVTLIDFGTAREYKEKNLADTTCLGTIGYAAPEQFGGMGQTDARTDIYCLGATLYHLVTGMNPSEPPYEIRPICDINPGLSGGLERIILKCTQRNPDDRYQSCAELMYDLEHYEEIDDVYRKKQMKKLGLFAGMTVLSVAFAMGGFAVGQVARSKATDFYEEYMENADSATNDTEKIDYYTKAIAVPNKAGTEDAYLGLIKAIKSNNNESVFTAQEEEIIVSQIMNNRKELEANPEAYVDVCFELGKLYWYYYDNGNGDNQANRMKSSIKWFENAINYASEDYPNVGMCKVYSSIGSFYRDITTATVEASDRGLYRPFFDELNQLIDTVFADDEDEIVKLELLELARSAMQQYATKMKKDEVSLEEMQALYQKVESHLDAVATTTDATDEKKASTKALLQDTLNAIQLAYGAE